MSSNIDPKAMVSPKAKIGRGCVIGPYAVIADEAVIGQGCVIDSFAQVLGHTEIGQECRIFSYAVVGNIPQDLKYKGGKSYLRIGKENKIREFVTINPGTDEGAVTLIGDNNLFMVSAHVAHDCRIGNNNILANSVALAGHVEVEDYAVVGGLAAVHQFCRVGSHAIIGGCSKVVQDIPPYAMCDGHPAKICGINLVGLRRRGFSRDSLQVLRRAFKVLFFEDHSMGEALSIAKESCGQSDELTRLLSFIASSKRGVCK